MTVAARLSVIAWRWPRSLTMSSFWRRSPPQTSTILGMCPLWRVIIFKPGYRYKNAGVTFLDLVPAGRVQSGLFDQPDDARSVGRMRAIDQLNARFGRGTVGFGTAGERQAWSLRREFTSRRYTTDWNELLRV
jgi:Domain of unknown function (DUF4113)